VSLNGHECAIAIPNHIFFEVLKRSDPDHPAFELYTEEEMSRGGEEQLYIIEGTGCLFPEPRARSARHMEIERKFKRVASSFTKIVDPVVFYDPQREDNFYKQMITLMTAELFLKTGHLGFEFLVCRKTASGLRRGVPFALLLDIAKHTDVSIVQAPTMSPELFRVSTRIDDDDFPPIALVPCTITPEMQHVCKMLTTKRPAPGQEYFQFQVKFQYMTSENVARIQKIARQLNVDVLCVAEPIKKSFSDSEKMIGGYTVLFF